MANIYQNSSMLGSWPVSTQCVLIPRSLYAFGLGQQGLSVDSLGVTRLKRYLCFKVHPLTPHGLLLQLPPRCCKQRIHESGARELLSILLHTRDRGIRYTSLRYLAYLAGMQV